MKFKKRKNHRKKKSTLQTAELGACGPTPLCITPAGPDGAGQAEAPQPHQGLRHRQGPTGCHRPQGAGLLQAGTLHTAEPCRETWVSQNPCTPGTAGPRFRSWGVLWLYLDSGQEASRSARWGLAPPKSRGLSVGMVQGESLGVIAGALLASRPPGISLCSSDRAHRASGLWLAHTSRRMWPEGCGRHGTWPCGRCHPGKAGSRQSPSGKSRCQAAGSLGG